LIVFFGDTPVLFLNFNDVTYPVTRRFRLDYTEILKYNNNDSQVFVLFLRCCIIIIIIIIMSMMIDDDDDNDSRSTHDAVDTSL